jgi:acyloxyacyl hydrolase
LDKSVHPGRIPNNGDIGEDMNCNGIFGKDPNSTKSYEEIFCKNSKQIGVAVLGDSISAHFHLPEEWFDATTISAAAFEHLAFILENELDWPQLSASTGYMNSTWSVTKGATRSTYLNLVNRNRCNFRDYQNIAVNGARTGSMIDISKRLTS